MIENSTFELSLKKDAVAVDIEAVGIEYEALTPEEEIKRLKTTLDSISQMFYLIRKENNKKHKKVIPKKDALNNTINADGIPINTFYIGYTKGSACPAILMVNTAGQYSVGNKIFPSLSAAAEHVSGIKRSGWSFWQTIDGVFLKDLYK